MKLVHIEEVHRKASHLSGLDSTVSLPNIPIWHIHESLESDVGDARRVGDLSHWRGGNSGVELYDGIVVCIADSKESILLFFYIGEIFTQVI